MMSLLNIICLIQLRDAVVYTGFQRENAGANQKQNKMKGEKTSRETKACI